MTTSDDRRFMGYGPRPDGFFPLTKAVLDPERLPPVLTGLFPPVLAAAKEPFAGITTDGDVVPDLFALQDEGFDPRGAVAAARGFLSLLSPQQQAAARFDIDAEQWRWWINAFPLWDPHGLFLDDLDAAPRTAALDVVQACLSAKGFADTRAAMRLNGALGELIGQYPDTLREYAYFFAIYGDPSADGPWGWQLWGHHLDVHCFVLGRQIVLTPAFIGAEPVVADRRRYAGTRLFDAERAAGLVLRRSLTTAQEQSAVLYRSILSTDLPPDKVNFVDGRHQGGAGRDNRVIPYEGIPARDLSPGQRELLADLVAAFAARLPEAPAAALSERFRAHQDEAHLAWIGGDGDDDAFYYKVHSPVLLIEFDCHQGVFLDNEEPEPFHVHTIVRARSKGTDTFAPCGPWIVSRDDVADPHDLQVSLTIDGELCSQDHTGNLVYRVPQIIAYVSRWFTLEPGDIVHIGTSARGKYRLRDIDLQERKGMRTIEIDGVGALVNPIKHLAD